MKTGSWNPCAFPVVESFFFFPRKYQAGPTNKRERNSAHKRSKACCQHEGPDHFPVPFLNSSCHDRGSFCPFLFVFAFLWNRWSVECYTWAFSSLLLDYEPSTLIFYIFRYCYNFEDKIGSSVLFNWIESFAILCHGWSTKLKCTFAYSRKRN